MSSLKLTYYSDVKEGTLQTNVRERIAKELSAFNGNRVEVTIQRLKSKRSVQQNRLWWLYISIISHELGYTKEECHEIFKYKFLKREKYDEKTGEVFEYLGSTSTLNKSDFVELVDELIRYCAQHLSIVLPMPNEQLEIE